VWTIRAFLKGPSPPPSALHCPHRRCRVRVRGRTTVAHFFRPPACGKVLLSNEENPKSAINALAERLVFARDDSDEMMEVIEQIGYLSCAAGNRECFRFAKAIPMLAQKLGNSRTAFQRIALWCLGNLIVENPSCAIELVDEVQPPPPAAASCCSLPPTPTTASLPPGLSHSHTLVCGAHRRDS